MTYKRLLLKLSGEALMGDQSYGLSPITATRIVEEVIEVHQHGIEIALVVGGGNIFRGMAGVSQGLERTTADNMGMLATVMNALALKSIFEAHDIEARVMSAIPMPTVCEPYIRDKALSHLDRKRVIIFAAGIGNPFFTTDTAAALRATEMKCDAMFKATKVPGVFDADPTTTPKAKHYPTLSYAKILRDDLKVMDASAIALARENNIPIVVFSILEKGAFLDTIRGKGKFTLVQ